jgi:hypothetical protein
VLFVARSLPQLRLLLLLLQIGCGFVGPATGFVLFLFVCTCLGWLLDGVACWGCEVVQVQATDRNAVTL